MHLPILSGLCILYMAGGNAMPVSHDSLHGFDAPARLPADGMNSVEPPAGQGVPQIENIQRRGIGTLLKGVGEGISEGISSLWHVVGGPDPNKEAKQGGKAAGHGAAPIAKVPRFKPFRDGYKPAIIGELDKAMATLPAEITTKEKGELNEVTSLYEVLGPEASVDALSAIARREDHLDIHRKLVALHPEWSMRMEDDLFLSITTLAGSAWNPRTKPFLETVASGAAKVQPPPLAEKTRRWTEWAPKAAVDNPNVVGPFMLATRNAVIEFGEGQMRQVMEFFAHEPPYTPKAMEKIYENIMKANPEWGNFGVRDRFRGFWETLGQLQDKAVLHDILKVP